MISSYRFVIENIGFSYFQLDDFCEQRLFLQTRYLAVEFGQRLVEVEAALPLQW